MHLFLQSHFGDVSAPRLSLHNGEDDEDDLMVVNVRVDEEVARVDLINMKVECGDDDLKRRVEAVVEMAMATMRPLSRSFVGSGLEAVKGGVA